MTAVLEHGALALLGLEWLRPWGLLALLAPLLLLLFLRRPRPPRSEATGTLELWRLVGGEALASSGRTRRGLSWRAWLLCAALGVAALAIAGPRRERTPERERWRVIVDRSPSMYLPCRVEESETRYEVALAGALAILDAVAGESAEVRWITPGEASVSGNAPPASWRSAPRAPRGEPRWERWDAPGNLWVTDRGAPRPREGAGVAASGGEAIPGAIGALPGGRYLVWDGDELSEGGAVAPGRVAVAEELPAALRRLVTIWAEERGLELDGAGGDATLRLVAAGGAERVPVEAGRGGWELTGAAALPEVPAADDEGPLTEWLRGKAGGPLLVAHAPGRIVIALREIASIGGDPATFASSWAELLDAAALPPEGVLSLAERRAAGEPRRTPPTAAVGEEGTAREVGVEAWLALAAVILAALAWSGRGGAPGRSRGLREGNEASQ